MKTKKILIVIIILLLIIIFSCSFIIIKNKLTKETTESIENQLLENNTTNEIENVIV